MNVILFDKNPKLFYPLSLTRPISEFKIGIFTIKQKWSQYYDNISYSCEQHLNNIYPTLIAKNNLWIDSTIIPNNNLIVELNSLKNGEALYQDDILNHFKDYKTIESANKKSNRDVQKIKQYMEKILDLIFKTEIIIAYTGGLLITTSIEKLFFAKKTPNVKWNKIITDATADATPKPDVP